MTTPRRVLLAGATGLVGAHVLQRLLVQPSRPQVLAPVRRPLQIASEQLSWVTTDLADSTRDSELAERLRTISPEVDVFVCALGTTIRRAGSREAFLAVDRDLVVRLAGIARTLGAKQAVLVSAVGASAQSGNFYLRVKGETERALGDLGFDRLDLLRPGLLLGDRSETRTGESIGKMLAPLTNPLMRGSLRRYRAIEADEVAAAAVALLGHAQTGRFVHEYAELKALALG